MMEGRGNPQTPSLPRANVALHQRLAHKESLVLQIKKEFRPKSLKQNEPQQAVEMVKNNVSFCYFCLKGKTSLYYKNNNIPLKRVKTETV